MEFMKSIIVMACVLSVILTIAGHLKSGEKFSRQLNVIFAFIFVSGVLGTAVKVGIDFKLPDYSGEEYEGEYFRLEENSQKVLKAEIENRTNKIIEDLLNKNNISYDKISSDININDDGSISINKIDYKGDDFERAGKLIESNIIGAEVNRIE